MFKEYILENHTEELKEMLKDPDEFKYYSLYVDFIVLFDYDPEKANNMLKQPRHYLALFDSNIIEVQEQLIEAGQIVKKKIRTRVHGVPEDINQAEIGELVFITGFVVRISQPSISIIAKHLLCKKCKHINIIKIQWETGKFPNVRQCEACKRKGLHPETSLQDQECVDYQEIKIQDKSQNHNDIMSTSEKVILLEDLVDKCTTGDYVNINGFLIRKWGNIVEGQRILCTTFMMANSLIVRKKITESIFCKNELTNVFDNYWKNYEANPLQGRDNILVSICPQLYGMYYMKLALALVLAGGVRKTSKPGTRIRGDIHLLLCGDPGTGKSQILQTATKLSNRSVLTTGIGSTAAGLTAAAVKDSDGWHLEAGALVSANGGVCCIDELTTMSTNDMASIHEAMEQQTISIAKAGMISTLKSKCSVIAAINPVGGRFVDGEEVKMGLGDPLLSRFDLILFLRDNPSSEWDELVSSHILQTAMSNGNDRSKMNSSDQDYNSMSESMYKDNFDASSNIEINSIGSLSSIKNGVWDEKSLCEYFSHIHTFEPSMSKEAEKILCTVYSYHRQKSGRRQERTTVRLMDSLIRLAEAHAKLMYRTKILVMDAIFAAKLINLSIEMDNENNKFPTDSLSTYKNEGAEILGKLNLDDLVGLL